MTKPGTSSSSRSDALSFLKKQTEGASGSFSSDDDIPQSIIRYYRSLSGSEPLAAGEQLKLWKEFASATDGIREILYRFAFVHREHVRVLGECTFENVHDVFLPSSFDDPETYRSTGLMMKLVSEWLKDIKFALEKEENLFDGGGDVTKLVDDAVKLLSRHKVHSDNLYEWFDVAKNYASELSGAEPVTPERTAELEKIFFMDAPQVISSVKKLEDLFEKRDRSRSALLNAHLRLVVSIANKFHGHKLQPGDLIQEGNLGLLRALDRFDYTLGHQFSTYASWWIRQSVARAIAMQERIIRLPRHMLSLISRIDRAEQSFIQLNGRNPTPDDIASMLELPRERVSAVMKMARQAISLQAPISDRTGGVLENFLSDADSTNPEKELAFKFMQDHLKKAFSVLSERERQILRMRFGLDGSRVWSLLEISQAFHLTKERIRQIECRAMKRLREPEVAVYLKDYFES